MIAKLFRRFLCANAQDERAREHYVAAVHAAREPIYYTEFAVADTLDGRFDMIVLQLFLRIREADEALKQALMEQLIADMDQNLREMGVGDVSIGKKVPKMAYAMNGRLQAYAAAWGDEAAFAKAILRNVYRGDASKTAQAQALAAYIQSGESLKAA